MKPALVYTNVRGVLWSRKYEAADEPIILNLAMGGGDVSPTRICPNTGSIVCFPLPSNAEPVGVC